MDKLVKDSVKIIRSDNGTEFKNLTMEEFCKERGVVQQFSAPGTPQQNGVVERKNRTLIEAARTMLDEAKLPTYFWAEAVQTACFTQNATLIKLIIHSAFAFERVIKENALRYEDMPSEASLELLPLVTSTLSPIENGLNLYLSEGEKIFICEILAEVTSVS